MSFMTLCLCVFIIQLHFIDNHDFGNLEEYADLYNPVAKIYQRSPHSPTKSLSVKQIKCKRQVASAAPVIKHVENRPEENKFTGSSFVMKCEPKSTPAERTNITWFRNNVAPVTRSDRGGVLPVTYDMWSLLLSDLVPGDNGNYTCRLCNPTGCTERMQRLIITGNPELFPYIRRGYPGNATVLINDSVVLSCPTANLTDYSVKWVKLIAEPWNIASSKEISNRKDKYIISENSLTISYAKKEDEGWYMCITNNTMGSDRANGFLRVTNSTRGPSNGDHTNNESTTSKWLTPTLSILLIISLIVVLVVFIKLRSERIMKRHAVDTAREVMFEQWMKVVSIETQRSNGYTPDGTLVMPKVRIEKQRLSDIAKEYPHYVHSVDYVLPIDKKWEIDRRFLTLGDVLGEGEFGRVVQAKYHKEASRSDIPNVVAVKMLKEVHSDADMISFVSEMEIMKMIGKHENIINLLGCCTKDGPFYVVVEYASNGCLRDYLKKHKPTEKSEDSTEEKLSLKHNDLVQFALQVARGMCYLASHGCIHRDLAARNVLVSGTRVLKVADFGLARDVRDSDYYRKRTAGKLPVRWMAPESLCHNYYTTKSDVVSLKVIDLELPAGYNMQLYRDHVKRWSFGVLTWEIMTYGNTPYANIPVHFLYNYLRQGKRMEKPSNCSEHMYQLIQHCCTFNPDDRPTFSQLKEKLEVISSTDY